MNTTQRIPDTITSPKVDDGVFNAGRAAEKGRTVPSRQNAMSRHKKLTDASILGCIKANEQGERSGPTQREIARFLDVSLGTVQEYLRVLLDSGEVEKSSIRGYITLNGIRRHPHVRTIK